MNIIYAFPEIFIITLNLICISILYFLLFKTKKLSYTNIAQFDFFVTAISTSIAGVIFWNTGTQFNFALFNVNWFWFSLITYILVETILLTGLWKKIEAKNGISFKKYLTETEASIDEEALLKNLEKISTFSEKIDIFLKRYGEYVSWIIFIVSLLLTIPFKEYIDKILYFF